MILIDLSSDPETILPSLNFISEVTYNSIKIWDPNEDFKCINTLLGHHDCVTSLIMF